MTERMQTRKEAILKCLIEAFIRKPEPVGSKKIQECSGLSVSAATIRNEMSELENMGYVTHPHTSAGRIPTDQGYRYYVDHLMSNDTQERQNILHVLENARQRIVTTDDFLQVVTNIVSVFTQQVGIVVFPSLDDLYLKYANFIYLNEKRVLVVWTTGSGVIREQIVHLSTPIDQAMLVRIMNFVNEEFSGMSFYRMQQHIYKKMLDVKDSYRDLLTITSKIVSESIAAQSTKRVWVDGMRRFFDAPEFQDVATVRPLFEVMDNESSVVDMFEHHNREDALTVTIGQENTHKDFWNCSIIRKNFYVNEDIVGTISILGPRRMHYGDAVSTVNLASDLVSQVFRENLYF